MASGWKKRLSRPAALLRQTRPRSSPSLTIDSTPALKAVKRYDEEAEKCLRDLEFEINLLGHGRDRKSPSLFMEEMQTSTTTTTTTLSTQQAHSPDLLGTFCHLMHYVVHLRRENRHLQKQVLCLDEMRQIERLQNELLRSACTCETGATACAALTETKEGDCQKKCRVKKSDPYHLWRHSMPEDAIAMENNSNISSTKPASNSSAILSSNSKSNSPREDVSPAVTKCGGAPKVKILGDDEECDGVAEKRSYSDRDRGQMPPAPVTASAEESFGAEQGKQQLSSKSSRPLNSSSVEVKEDISLSNGGSHVQLQNRLSDSVGKSVGHPPSLTASRSLLSPPQVYRRRWTDGKSSRYVRDGAEEALAELNDDKTFCLMRTSIGEDSYSPRSMSSAGSSLTRSFHPGMQKTSSPHYLTTSPTSITDSDEMTSLKNTFYLTPRYSDSDQDQSVFTEVQLPDYRRPPSIPQSPLPTHTNLPPPSYIPKRYSGSPRTWRHSDLNCTSNDAQESYSALSFANQERVLPRTTSSQKVANILGRFGLKRPSILSRKKTEKSASICESLVQQKSDFVSKSMYDEKLGNEKSYLSPPCRGQSVVELPTDRWKLARKAFLKKRKRKISESDSLASSDASGKSYMTIELPDINYCRKPPAVMTPAIDSRSTKMHQFQQERRMTNENDASKISSMIKMDIEHGSRLSQKGQQMKGGWLREPKRKGDMTDQSMCDRYFEKDDGRQNTVVENDDHKQGIEKCTRMETIGWRGSDSNISKNAALDEVTGQIPCGPNKPPQLYDKQQQHNEEQKLRSVTFLEQSTPMQRVVSLTTSQQLTISNDSVFTSQDGHLNSFDLNKLNRQYEKEIRQQQQTSNVVEQLLILQERNSLLLRTLKDKTQEYERITERLCDLEKEMQTLRDKQRYDANLEQIYNAITDPNLVPLSFVQEIEKQIEQLDNDIRMIKTEAYETQQLALETHANDQAVTTRYINQIDNLQKANFHLLSKTFSELNQDEYPEIRRQLELLPTYEALYSFTINLLRKLKQVRTKLLEKNFSVSKLDLELLQTQSSLLLAHAQLERQKMQLRLLKTKYHLCNTTNFMNDRKNASPQLVRRTHSYHGQDMLARTVNAELSFYLPFKLHGFHTNKRDNRRSIISLYNGDEDLELEFAKLFDTVNRLSGHYDEIQIPLHTNPVAQKHEDIKVNSKQAQYSKDNPAVEMRMHRRQRGEQKLENQGEKSTVHNLIKTRNQNRPISCHVPVKETEVKKIVEEIKAGRYFMSNSAGGAQVLKSVNRSPPNYLKKAPPPLKLGNVGQVKAIAAAFDGANEDATSTPNTPTAKRNVRPQSGIVIRETKLAASRHQEMKPASHRREFDRPIDQSKISKIPIRPTVGSRMQSPYGNTNAKSTTKPESPYETLTFLCREGSVTSPQSSFSQLSPSTTSCSVGIMEKSFSPDIDTISSTTSTAGSTWSMSKRNEAKKLQFLYGQAKQRLPELPTSPIPPSSPTPKTPPTPIPPTPTPPRSSRFPEFQSTNNQRKGNAKNGKEKGPEPVAGMPVEKRYLKKPSWFQKLRHKN